jgi:DNA-binding NtrC family response regulator
LTDGEPFRMAKARIVTEFERHYVSEMLSQHRGNISQAARAARKNRRAFWQLMRKHEIAADVYRASAAG